MKKQEIYVPIANKKEAKRAKAVLMAMGEKCSKRFYIGNETGLWYYKEDEVWSCCQEGGNNYGYRTKITLKQLIELLVSEQKEPEKITVRVDNEKEFNAIEKYRLSLGFDKSTGKGDMEFPLSMQIEKKWGHTHVSGENTYLKDYKIIAFSEFAKEHGIRVPLLVSEDGVELFYGDKIFEVSLGIFNNKWRLVDAQDGKGYWICDNSKTVRWVKTPDNSKAFSTKKAALDWIEAQKPKEVEYASEFGIKCQITKDEALLTCGCGCFSITRKDTKAIHKAMEELNS